MVGPNVREDLGGEPSLLWRLIILHDTKARPLRQLSRANSGSASSSPMPWVSVRSYLRHRRGVNARRWCRAIASLSSVVLYEGAWYVRLCDRDGEVAFYSIGAKGRCSPHLLADTLARRTAGVDLST